jgi:hypothetical protein
MEARPDNFGSTHAPALGLNGVPTLEDLERGRPDLQVGRLKRECANDEL